VLGGPPCRSLFFSSSKTSDDDGLVVRYTLFYFIFLGEVSFFLFKRFEFPSSSLCMQHPKKARAV